MKQAWKRVRAAVVIGLLWAAVWAPVAVVIGTTIVDPDNSMDEMWVSIGALPGFLGGVVFSAVLGLAARRQRLHELSPSRVAVWGAVAGLLVSLLPFVLGDPSSDHPMWLLALVVISSVTLLSAASAAGSLAIARMSAPRDLLEASAGAPRVALVEGEAKPLPGDRRSVRSFLSRRASRLA